MRLLLDGAASLGIALDGKQIDQFEAYYRELTGAKLNLTAISGYENVQRRLFLESLAVLAVLRKFGRLVEGGTASVLDLGSGGGFPGVPLKIAVPSLRLALVEATRRKAAFLSGLVQRLDLSDVFVIADRAEVVAHDALHRETYDVVTARAVAAMPALVELGLPFVKIGGRYGGGSVCGEGAGGLWRRDRDGGEVAGARWSRRAIHAGFDSKGLADPSEIPTKKRDARKTSANMNLT
jgi:16S rRNA (guanine527-N7)-methyltransferase